MDKSATANSESQLTPDEIAAIGLALLLQYAEAWGRYGRISAVSHVGKGRCSPWEEMDELPQGDVDEKC